MAPYPIFFRALKTIIMPNFQAFNRKWTIQAHICSTKTEEPTWLNFRPSSLLTRDCYHLIFEELVPDPFILLPFDQKFCCVSGPCFAFVKQLLVD